MGCQKVLHITACLIYFYGFQSKFKTKTSVVNGRITVIWNCNWSFFSLVCEGGSSVGSNVASPVFHSLRAGVSGSDDCVPHPGPFLHDNFHPGIEVHQFRQLQRSDQGQTRRDGRSSLHLSRSEMALSHHTSFSSPWTLHLFDSVSVTESNEWNESFQHFFGF